MWPTKIAQVLCGGPFPFEHAGGGSSYHGYRFSYFITFIDSDSDYLILFHVFIDIHLL